jgi:hypothetical protein
MKRRDFLTGLLLALTTQSAEAQQKARVYRLAVVDPINPVNDITALQNFLTIAGSLRGFNNLDLVRGVISKSSDFPLTDIQIAFLR